MEQIKNLVFDFGGVIITLNRQQAVDQFVKIGVKDADKLIDPYHQKGVFLEVEDGRIDADEFCIRLSEIAGKKLSYEEVEHGWLGFIADIPLYKLDYLSELRKTYDVYLLSNTNPFVMGWARSERFTANGKRLDDYVDKIYASYEVGAVKPDRRFFEYLIKDSRLLPSETLFIDDGVANIEAGRELGFQTYLAKDGEDWRRDVDKILKR